MTDFNNNNKLVPTAPKTYTVSELRDTQQPVKKSSLSAAARNKVVNRSGGNYVSENQGYGPCSYSGCPYSTDFDIDLTIEGNRRKWARRPNDATWLRGNWEYGFWTSHYLSSWNLWLANIDEARRVDPLLANDTVYTVNLYGAHCAEDNRFCNCALSVIQKAIRHHENGEEVRVSEQINSDISKWSRWGFKVATGAGLTALTGPLGTAMVGGTIYGLAKGAENSDSANEYDKKIFRSISSFGGDLARGGLISGVAETGGQLIGEIATGGSIVGGEIFKEFAKEAEGNVGKIITGSEFVSHSIHKLEGKNYDSSCPICKS